MSATTPHSSTKSRAAGSGGTLEETKQETASAARSLAEDAKTAARDAADSVKAEAVTRADDAKSGVADEVDNVSAALRKAAEASREGSPQERTFGQIAEGLADVSETIANKDLGEMAGDISDFARRNPLAFLGGAALIGFAATRFAKAGRRPSTPHVARGNPPATDYAGASRPGAPMPAYRPNSAGGAS